MFQLEVHYNGDGSPGARNCSIQHLCLANLDQPVHLHNLLRLPEDTVEPWLSAVHPVKTAQIQ